MSIRFVHSVAHSTIRKFRLWSCSEGSKNYEDRWCKICLGNNCTAGSLGALLTGLPLSSLGCFPLPPHMIKWPHLPPPYLLLLSSFGLGTAVQTFTPAVASTKLHTLVQVITKELSILQHQHTHSSNGICAVESIFHHPGLGELTDHVHQPARTPLVRMQEQPSPSRIRPICLGHTLFLRQMQDPRHQICPSLVLTSNDSCSALRHLVYHASEQCPLPSQMNGHL